MFIAFAFDTLISPFAVWSDGPKILSSSGAASSFDPLLNYSVTLATAEATSELRDRVTRFVQTASNSNVSPNSRGEATLAAQQRYIPTVARLYSQCFAKSEACRLASLSTLAFSTPMLVCLWRWIELEIGCSLASSATASSGSDKKWQSQQQQQPAEPKAVWETALWCALTQQEPPATESFFAYRRTPLHLRGVLDGQFIQGLCVLRFV